jgi:ABC-2 type transport system permease protein
MPPPWVRYLNYGNPYFYFISGIRGAMIGFNEIPADVAVALTLVLLITLSALTWRLYAQGYGLRE